MTSYRSEIQNLEDETDQVQNAVSTISKASAAFKTELIDMEKNFKSTGQQAEALGRNLSSSLKSAFGDLLFEGAKLSDVLKNIGRSMMEASLNSALNPIVNGLGNFIGKGIGNAIAGLSIFEDGAAFSQGRVMPFAKGGIVSSATRFPMRGGVGMMGEAGPEAIMPLMRGSDGSLGVRANSSSQSVVINMNISTPDIQGFKRSQGQIAAGLNRAMQRGQRNF